MRQFQPWYRPVSSQSTTVVAILMKGRELPSEEESDTEDKTEEEGPKAPGEEE
jgi:hypothetical protein